ncbi:MAG: hypothetical protein FJZ96_05815, partial [Chloroflexi bacterium]|nr:hypothetical protein [Chloroflexota bacterium]
MQTGWFHWMVESPLMDVVPPPTVPLAGISVGVIAALCCLVVVVGLAAFFVIRAVRKNRTPNKTPPA